MGKSDVAHLKPDNLPYRFEMAESDQPKLISIESQHKDLDKCISNENPPNNGLPMGMELLANQVAGHMYNNKTPGMLKCNGKVLKPITKPKNGQREIDFYENLNRASDDTFLELKQFVPKYYGTTTITVNDKEIKCIVLEDLTRHFKEPCIMDVKIGKRTWDPLATYDKIIAEDKKYQETKRDLGISVPGFLVHKLSNGKVCRFRKDYGRKLNSETIKDALRIFLNADSGLSRDLILQLLVDLWKILHWARNQRRIRLFASSLLFIYDARRLRQYPTNNNSIPKPPNGLSSTVSPPSKSSPLYKPLSLMKLDDDCTCTGFSGQFTKEGPILSSTHSTKLPNFAPSTGMNVDSNHPWEKRISKLRRVHSFQNNYDKDLQNLRRDYTYMLDDLVDDQQSDVWATVKLIDFAHVFPAEHCDIDKNYLEGIENVVKLFEEFLKETVEL